MSIIEDGLVHMARLAICGSFSVNGVAALHTHLLKTKELSDFNDIWPEKFINITNGVTQRRWLLKCNSELSDFISDRIGQGWIHDFSLISKLAEFANDRASQKALMKIKYHNKKRLAAFIKENNPIRDKDGNEIGTIDVNCDSIFDVQVKRLHEYKRQLMNALQILMTYHEIKEGIDDRRVPRTFIFGAKAPTGYFMARNIIVLINAIARLVNNDPAVKDKLNIVFIENYNVSRAELIFPAADLSEQISTASQEASGTGNMKFAINGALTIGTDDGANVEMREAIGDTNWPFLFGLSSEEAIPLMKGKHNPIEFLETAAPIMQRVINDLKEPFFAETEEEKDACEVIYQALLYGWEGDKADRFLVLRDLMAYHETQKKVDRLYRDSSAWAACCMHNIAAMGTFSSDVSIAKYCDKVWGIKPVEIKAEKIQNYARDLGLDDSIYTLV
jgi:starch phosphorylase